MSRTFRRRDARYEYSWVLRDRESRRPLVRQHDAGSREGRKVIALFHADSTQTMRSTAPRWYRRLFQARIDHFNARMLRRWLADPGFDPVFDPKHRHGATWSWW